VITPPIIDCDVHNGLRSRDDLKDYLPSRWHRYYDDSAGWVSAAGSVVPSAPRRGVFRHDATPPEGGPPGSSLDYLKAHLLDAWGVERAVLSPLESIEFAQHGEDGGALHTALNDWLVDRWLTQDERLCGSISVPVEDPTRAAVEIRLRSSDENFVQVLVLASTRDPLGNARYRPMLEAAADAGLPIAIHVGGHGGTLTSCGPFRYYLERRALYPHAFQTHLVSMITNGVFEALPELRVIMMESGFVWLPSLLWRLDRAWRDLGPEATRLGRAPSEIVRRHFWFSTQPIDEPAARGDWLQTLDWTGMHDRLMFATDYPHWDFDAPDQALPVEFDDDLRKKVFSENAKSVYTFSSARART
jgi:uncharacterized protein